MKLKSFLKPFIEDKKFNSNILLIDNITSFNISVGDSDDILKAVINYEVVQTWVNNNKLTIVLKK